jgi:hypothetical protein
MLDEFIQQILGHFQFHPKLVGQRLPVDTTADRVAIDLGDATQVELFLRRSDMYVLGYVGEGKSYVVNEHPTPDINGINLGYDSAYMSLGWNRTAKPRILVTEQNIASSLYAASTGTKLGKQQYLYLALLIEATRFVDVSYNMINGKQIDKTQLDWLDQAKKGNARVLKADMRYTMADEV